LLGSCLAIGTVGNDYHQYTPYHAEAEALFQLFEIERFDEVEQDGQTAGWQKHWHLFHIVVSDRCWWKFHSSIVMSATSSSGFFHA